MAKNIFSIDCSTISCATGNLGAIEELDPKCPKKIDRSEINYLLLMHPTLGVPPTDWTVAGAGGWADVIDNTDATDVKVKRLYCIGDKPAETRADIPSADGIVIKGEGTYTLNITLPDLPDNLYDYLRKVQCGKVVPTVWYEDRGGNMFGANDGIETNSIVVNFIKDRGDDAYNRAELIITFVADTDPDRIVSPLQ